MGFISSSARLCGAVHSCRNIRFRRRSVFGHCSCQGQQSCCKSFLLLSAWISEALYRWRYVCLKDVLCTACMQDVLCTVNVLFYVSYSCEEFRSALILSKWWSNSRATALSCTFRVSGGTPPIRPWRMGLPQMISLGWTRASCVSQTVCLKATQHRYLSFGCDVSNIGFSMPFHID